MMSNSVSGLACAAASLDFDTGEDDVAQEARQT